MEWKEKESKGKGKGNGKEKGGERDTDFFIDCALYVNSVRHPLFASSYYDSNYMVLRYHFSKHTFPLLVDADVLTNRCKSSSTAFNDGCPGLYVCGR